MAPDVIEFPPSPELVPMAPDYPAARSSGRETALVIRHTYFIARNIKDADPRRQLAIAFRNQSPNITYVRCTHGAHVDDNGEKYPQQLSRAPAAKRKQQRGSHGPESPATLQNVTSLPCSCAACHAKVWKHINKRRAAGGPDGEDSTGIDPRTWFLVADLDTLSVQDTLTLRPWLNTIPLTQVYDRHASMVVFNDRSSTYLVTTDGVIGLSMVQKGRHPEEYTRYLRPVIVSHTPFSIVAILLDVLGFEDLVTLLTTSLIRVNITRHYTLDLNYFHVIAVIIFIVNQMYTRMFVVDVLVSVELLMLLLLSG